MLPYLEIVIDSKATTVNKRPNSVSSKLATMVVAHIGAKPVRAEECSNVLSKDKLIAKLAKQHASLKEDVLILIQNSITPLQTSLQAVHEKVNLFQSHLTRVEHTMGQNLQRQRQPFVNWKQIT